MNLITDPWIPVRTRAGRRTIRPAEVVDRDVIAVDFPRPDMTGATVEFLIGLLSTAGLAADEAAWAAGWRDRPTAHQLDTTLAPHVPAWSVQTAMQTPSQWTPQPIEGLFLDAPGDNTEKLGKDFLRRSQDLALSPGAALAATMALQMYTGAAGRCESGAYLPVSLRGGGPLTTLVVGGDDLWGQVWPNVETVEQMRSRGVGSYGQGLANVYPWLADQSDAVTPDGTHPAYVYWAMPRSVQLLWGEGGVCSLTGQKADTLVREIRLDCGAKATGFTHPLSPYREVNGQWLPVLSPKERIGYRDWLGFVTLDENRRPALAVSHVRAHRYTLRDARVVACGAVLSKAQYETWSEGVAPLWSADRDTRDVLDATARALVSGARQAVKMLRAALKDGRSPPSSGRFWIMTEAPFWAAMAAAGRVARDDADDATFSIRIDWLLTIRKAALAIFDGALPLDADHAGRLGQIVQARHRLAVGLKGYGKTGKALCAALGVPEPTEVNGE